MTDKPKLLSAGWQRLLTYWRHLLTYWQRLPLGLRWVLCWPFLAVITIAGFQASHLAALISLQTVLRIPSEIAHLFVPILADILHMAITLPAIRFLVPKNQYIVVAGLGVVVAFATVNASWQLVNDLQNNSAELWRSVRDTINTTLVLAIVIWYALRLQKQTRRARKNPATRAG